MRNSFDDILNECVRRLEASAGDIDAVLARYPDHAEELRPHLEVWLSLSEAERTAATPEATARGRQQLLTAMARADVREPGPTAIGTLATKGGLTMRYIVLFVAGAGLALGITFLTGNLDFGSDDATAQSNPSSECQSILDLNGDGETNLDDVLDMKTAIVDGDPEGDFDFDGNGETDVFDVVFKLNQFTTCLEDEGRATAP